MCFACDSRNKTVNGDNRPFQVVHCTVQSHITSLLCVRRQLVRHCASPAPHHHPMLCNNLQGRLARNHPRSMASVSHSWCHCPQHPSLCPDDTCTHHHTNSVLDRQAQKLPQWLVQTSDKLITSTGYTHTSTSSDTVSTV